MLIELERVIARNTFEIQNANDSILRNLFKRNNALLTEQNKALEQVLVLLKIAVLQNSCDMLMTGEELRKCEAAIEALSKVG